MNTQPANLPLTVEQTPFSSSQWQELSSLLRQLDTRQAMWLSGYLAAGPMTQAPVASESPEMIIWVLYGTETGNSEAIANTLSGKLESRGISHKVLPLARVKPRELKRADFLLVICSTHGDGEPPEPAADFFAALPSAPANSLNGTRHAVLALGDSSYEHYCTAGHMLDKAFAGLGSEPLLTCVECDVDFSAIAHRWCEQVQSHLPTAQTVGEVDNNQPLRSAPVPLPSVAKVVPSRDNPILAEVLENICLSDASREKPIHHLEFLVEPGSLQVEPGDAIGVLPNNSPTLVAQILELSGLSGEEPVVQKGCALSVVEAFRERVDLTVPSPALLTLWAEVTGCSHLQEKADAEKQAQRAYLKTFSVLDLLASTSAPVSVEPQRFIDALRPLQPRLYDVANTVDQHSDELHIAVKDFRYQLAGRECVGVASEYLQRLEPGEGARIYVHSNKRFRLPESLDAPLILIAQSTGVAPYRAFVQRLSERDDHPPVWLFLQEASREQDFLYQTDWQQAQADGVLQKINTLFRADEPEKTFAKVFTHCASELIDWLEKGAHLYICGEKLALSGVEDDIKTLCANSGAGDLWQNIKAQKRVHKNLY
jgi:sulfite reductase (NADPH) flavoprotein alpha-component